MEWTEEAFVLSARRHGEQGAVLSVLTKDHGRHAGFVRSATGKRNRGVFEPGNYVQATWKARLEGQLGSLSCELLTPYPSFILSDPKRLTCLQALTALLDRFLPEREPVPDLFAAFAQYSDALKENICWDVLYAQIELLLLEHLGYGLDLSECAATGGVDNLIYVSPKSGRSVSAEAGAPYKGRLLPLPSFLREENEAPVTDMDLVEAAKLTGFFLLKALEADGRDTLPKARTRYLKRRGIDG